jgi:hypothetical protein
MTLILWTRYNMCAQENSSWKIVLCWINLVVYFNTWLVLHLLQIILSGYIIHLSLLRVSLDLMIRAFQLDVIRLLGSSYSSDNIYLSYMYHHTHCKTSDYWDQHIPFGLASILGVIQPYKISFPLNYLRIQENPTCLSRLDHMVSDGLSHQACRTSRRTPPTIYI